jgi:nucleotide-binding universal stress UspA family protein
MEPSTLCAPAPRAIHIQRILVPIDFSGPSQTALRYARRFAEQFGGEITLLHVLEKIPVAAAPEMPPYFDFTEEQLNSAEKNLRALCAASKASASLPMRSTIRTGLAAHEIVEAAKEFDSDLIIIATHGYTGWMHFCIGSTTERVVRTAPCPVFVVREKEHDFI